MLPDISNPDTEILRWIVTAWRTVAVVLLAGGILGAVAGGAGRWHLGRTLTYSALAIFAAATIEGVVLSGVSTYPGSEPVALSYLIVGPAIAALNYLLGVLAGSCIDSLRKRRGCSKPSPTSP